MAGQGSNLVDLVHGVEHKVFGRQSEVLLGDVSHVGIRGSDKRRSNTHTNTLFLLLLHIFGAFYGAAAPPRLLLPNFFHLRVQNKRWEAKDRGVCVVFQPKFGSEIFTVYIGVSKRELKDCFKFWANSLANSSEKTDISDQVMQAIRHVCGESGDSGHSGW